MQVSKRFLSRFVACSVARFAARSAALCAALCAAACALLATPAAAALQATVDAVQMPAWLERNGRLQPLAPGMAVENGDRIRTGEGARAYLKLAEGSTVKLGENAQLAVFGRSLRPQQAFKGALDVITGAFRFTTDALRRVSSRDVTIRVGTATAGIRGTDLWGRSNPREDLVCLIEGQIEILHDQLAEPLAMSEPLTFFAAPRGAAPKAVVPVDPVQFRGWARETEIEPGDGAARRDGRWKLLLGRHATAAAALEQYDSARRAGYAVQIVPRAAAAGGWDYEVVLAGFPDEEEAYRTAARLKAATDIEAVAGR